jgi:predicted alpha/beta-fold hydrolase
MAGTATLRSIIERLPPFRPRLPWLGGDLQTMRNALVRPRPPIENWPAERVSFDMADGTGDRLHGLLHRPTEDRPKGDRQRPLTILIHGIGGSNESAYMRITAVHLLRAGYPVLRLNLRGAGGSETQQFYHAGRTEDLKRVIGSLDGRLAANGVVPVGFSLGANMMLKYLAECGAMAPVLAAVSISAPIDLAAAQRRIARRRNRIYQHQMLGWLRSERGVRLPPQLRTMLEFDTHVVAPANGFKDAQDYYRQCSAGSTLGAIRRPTLMIHAQDDPWIPASSYRDLAPNPNLFSLLLRSGGHVGFHARGLDIPWHDMALARFLGALG